MHAQVFELKFPDGDFEIDAAARVPREGEVVRKSGRVWRVDHVEPGLPCVVHLRPAQARTRREERSD